VIRAEINNKDDREIARRIADYITDETRLGHDGDWHVPSLTDIDKRFPGASLRAYAWALELLS
jgi:hypothetical protein